MVSSDGLAAKHLPCPRDPYLIAYFTRVAELHAAWKPGSVWLDDDFAFRRRVPQLRKENYIDGCFCDRCLAEFFRTEGRTWTRGELAEEIRRRSGISPKPSLSSLALRVAAWRPAFACRVSAHGSAVILISNRRNSTGTVPVCWWAVLDRPPPLHRGRGLYQTSHKSVWDRPPPLF